METPVSLNVVGVTRGVMEGRPWCKVHITEPFSVSPDAVGERASDVSAESRLLEEIAAFKLPHKIAFIGDLQISKNGARVRLLRVDQSAMSAKSGK